MALNECAIMFSGQNWADESEELGPAKYVPGLDYLKDPNMWTFFRYSGSPNDPMYFLRDLGGIKPVDVVGILKVNFRFGSLWRIRCYNDPNDPAGSEVFDSDWMDMFPGIDLFGTAEWGYFDWGGFSYNIHFGDYNRQAIYVLPAQTMARYVRIDLDLSETLSLDGFVQMARLWIGEGYQPTHSAVYGSGVRFTDSTTIKIAESGVKHRSRRIVKKRGMRVVLENEPKLELFYRFVGPIIGSRGASRDFLTMLEPRDSATLSFQTIYGSIAGETVGVTHEVWNRLSTTFDIEESI